MEAGGGLSGKFFPNDSYALWTSQEYSIKQTIQLNFIARNRWPTTRSKSNCKTSKLQKQQDGMINQSKDYSETLHFTLLPPHRTHIANKRMLAQLAGKTRWQRGEELPVLQVSFSEIEWKGQSTATEGRSKWQMDPNLGELLPVWSCHP